MRAQPEYSPSFPAAEWDAAITEEGAKHNSPDSLDFALRGERLKNAERLLPDIISDGTEIKRENRKVENGEER